MPDFPSLGNLSISVEFIYSDDFNHYFFCIKYCSFFLVSQRCLYFCYIISLCCSLCISFVFCIYFKQKIVTYRWMNVEYSNEYFYPSIFYRDVPKVFSHCNYLLYISYKTTIFENIIPKSILVQFWWNFYQQKWERM